MRLHRIESRGLGIQRHQFGGIETRQPGVEMRGIKDAFVAAAVGLGVGNSGRCRRKRRRWRNGTLAGRTRRRLFAAQLAQPALELKPRVKLGQLFGIRRQRRKIAHALWQGQVASHGDQLDAERQKLEMVPEVFADGAADLAGVGDDLVQRTVGIQPFDRRLGPDLGHPGHVVHGVAHQRQIIDDAFRRHAELGQHAGLVEHFVAHGVDQRDMRIHQLGEVLVAGRDDAIDPRLRRLTRQGADHVIGLDAVHHQQRPAGGADALVQGFDLGHQILGHRGPVRLVFRIPVVAEGLALGVEHHRTVI